jgi:acyl dehydratase
MYLEEFYIGQKFKLDTVSLSEEDIFEFAREYDPQPIHIKPEFADKSIFQGIIASGFHTLCSIWEKWIELNMYGDEIIGGMGLDYLNWTAPVRANDRLKTNVEVVDSIPSSKGGRGVLVLKFVSKNQNEQIVLVTQVRAMIKSRQ